MAKKASVKPETELKLDDLQEKYLQTRDPLIWKEMFDIMIKYARSLTLKVNKGKVFLEPDIVMAVATDAAIKIMERYNNPEFKITHSFAGLLHWKVIESLYGGWEEDAHLSLNYLIQDDSTQVELGDLQERIHAESFSPSISADLDTLNLDDINENIVNILQEFDSACNQSATNNFRLVLLSRVYLLLLLRKSKTRHSSSMFKKYLQLAPKEEELLDLLLLEMRNRLSLVS